MSEVHSLVAHQFDDAEQQKQASTVGMWVFLVTEIMFFGGLILAYIIYRSTHSLEFHAASYALNAELGLLNTCILLVSSLTMALAVHAAQTGKKKALVAYIIATMILGAGFLAVKAVEYSDKFEHHLVPGAHYDFHVADLPAKFAGYDVQKTELFFSLYFAMTGLHAFHMVIGLGIMTWLVIKAMRGRFSSAYYNPVEVSGLYWHFVDIVWIFLYPLLYLIDRS